MHPFSYVTSFSKISKPTGQNQKTGKQCFLPPLFFKICLRDTSFYISLNSLGFFYLFRMLVEFSVTCIFQHVWETFFNLWCSHSQKIIESRYAFLLMSQSPTQNSWQNFLKICFPQGRKGVGGSYNLLYQNSIRKYEDGLEHQFISIWYDCNFSKCVGFS